MCVRVCVCMCVCMCACVCLCACVCVRQGASVFCVITKLITTENQVQGYCPEVRVITHSSNTHTHHTHRHIYTHTHRHIYTHKIGRASCRERV